MYYPNPNSPAPGDAIESSTNTVVITKPVENEAPEIDLEKQAAQLLKQFRDNPIKWDGIYRTLEQNGGIVEFFSLAAKEGEKDVFLRMGAASDPHIYWPTIKTAVHYGQVDTMRALIQKRFDPSITGPGEWNVYHELAFTDPSVSRETQLKMFTVLRDAYLARDGHGHSANINQTLSNGYTPLHAAIDKGNFDLVQAYQTLGANVNPPMPEGTHIKSIPELAKERAKEFPEGQKVLTFIDAKIVEKSLPKAMHFAAENVTGNNGQHPDASPNAAYRGATVVKGHS